MKRAHSDFHRRVVFDVLVRGIGARMDDWKRVRAPIFKIGETMNDVTDPDYQKQLAQQATNQLVKDIDGIIEVGRANFGSRTFDDASQVVADVLGPKAQMVMAMVRG